MFNSTNNDKPIITLHDLTFIYNGQSMPSLSHINLKILPRDFVIITGPSGSGKTTLVRVINGLIPHFYGGIVSGSAIVAEENIFETTPRKLIPKVGMVFQNPENQLLMTSVKSEVVFGLENLNLSRSEILQRLDHMETLFPFHYLFDRNLQSLSGGEKQKIALISILLMQPEIIILDEPTAELDPIAAEELLRIVQEIQTTLGITVLIIEHRLERLLDVVSRMIVLDQGTIVLDGPPRQALRSSLNHALVSLPPFQDLYLKLYQIPPILRIIQEMDQNVLPPLGNTEIHTFLQQIILLTRLSEGNFQSPSSLSHEQYLVRFENQIPLIELHQMSFGYSKQTLLFNHLNLKAFPGEIIGLIGRNGTGKTTLLKLMMGLLRPLSGEVFFQNKSLKNQSVAEIASKIGFVFQNPSMQFYQDTVQEEFYSIFTSFKQKKDMDQRINQLVDRFDLRPYLHSYPRSISFGEQQRTALAMVMGYNPAVLLLDEPTHGMDHHQQKQFMQFLHECRIQGTLVFLATHDIELIANLADRVLILDPGNNPTLNLTHFILQSYSLFHPQIYRIFADIFGSSFPFLTSKEVFQVIQNGSIS